MIEGHRSGTKVARTGGILYVQERPSGPSDNSIRFPGERGITFTIEWDVFGRCRLDEEYLTGVPSGWHRDRVSCVHVCEAEADDQRLRTKRKRSCWRALRSPDCLGTVRVAGTTTTSVYPPAIASERCARPNWMWLQSGYPPKRLKARLVLQVSHPSWYSVARHIAGMPCGA